MTLHKFTLDEYEEVVDMYYEFTKEVYINRKIGSKYFFYKNVINWINTNKDVIIAKNNNDITGFSMSYTDNSSGTLDTIYQTIIVYVKPEYRKSRAAYLMYKNVSDLANEKKISHASTGSIVTGGADIIEKHFGCKKVFTIFERTYNE